MIQTGSHVALSPPGAAVHGDDLTGDVVSSVAEQEDGGISHILDEPQTAERNDLLGSVLGRVLAAPQAGQPFGALDAAGGDDVAPDAAGAILESHGGHDGVDSRLCGGDVSLERHACVVEGSRDVEDAGAGAPEEVGDGGLDGVEGAEDVNVDDGLEGVGGHVLQGGDEVARGAGAECC